MKNIVLGILYASFVFLIGCDSTNKTFRTVEFFDKNKKERAKTILECKNMNNATLVVKQDCANAKKSYKHDTSIEKKGFDYTKFPGWKK